ncbi:MAG: hypothetical protein RLZ73_811 [Bacteroidota bacterium]
MKKPSVILFALLLTALGMKGQGSLDYGSGMKINFNDKGSKYMRFILWNQIWARSIDNNPGTSVNGTPSSNTFDIGARRIRMLGYSQISPRYMVVLHFGVNNQSFIQGGGSGSSGTGGYGAGKKPQMFFHDAYSEYAVILPAKDKKFSMSFGAGLHYFNGISRMTSASTLNFLAVDAPVFNWPLIENSDRGKLDYRVNINKPFATSIAPVNGTTEAIAVDNNGDSKLSTGGYAMYQFLDQESNLLPYTVGTYVGTKRVFNIGAGFYNQPDGTMSSLNGVKSKHAINSLAIDAFLDLPIGDKKKNMAITAYTVLYSNDFGPNYLRNTGIMNPGAADPSFTGTKALAGAGNARPLVGTGSIWYTQAGLLLPKNSDAPKLRVQPFVAYTMKQLDALPAAGSYFDIGSNFYIDGHNSKITLQYSSRPIYSTKDNISDYKGEFIIQFANYL